MSKKKIKLYVDLDTLKIIDEIVASEILGNTRGKVIRHILREQMFRATFGAGNERVYQDGVHVP